MIWRLPLYLSALGFFLKEPEWALAWLYWSPVALILAIMGDVVAQYVRERTA